MKKKIGNIAVDSGQIMIVDPCYVLDGKTAQEDEDLYKGWQSNTLKNTEYDWTTQVKDRE